jgi:hypothetical protein
MTASVYALYDYKSDNYATFYNGSITTAGGSIAQTTSTISITTANFFNDSGMGGITSATYVDAIILDGLYAKRVEILNKKYIDYNGITQSCILSATSATFGSFIFANIDAHTAGATIQFSLENPTCPSERIGEIACLQKKFEIQNNYDYADYTVKVNKKRIVHDMARGNSRQAYLENRLSFEIQFDYINTADYNNLLALSKLGNAFVIVPAATMTSDIANPVWDGIWAKVVWVNEFEFNQFTDNFRGNGYSGKMILQECPK